MTGVSSTIMETIAKLWRRSEMPFLVTLFTSSMTKLQEVLSWLLRYVVVKRIFSL